MTTLFDHLNAIYTNQSITYFDELEDKDRKTFDSFMIHRLVSMNEDLVDVANLIQRYELSPREVYLFYSQILPKKRRYAKYIKRQETGKKLKPEIVEVVAHHFSVSKKEAEDYIRLCAKTEDGKEFLRKLSLQYGQTDTF